MIPAVHHPDGGELVPVDDLLTDVYHLAQANAADVDAQESALKAQHDALSALAGRVGEQDQIIGALSERLTATEGAMRLQATAFEERLAEHGVWITELESRLESLVESLKPLPSGPQYGVDVSGHQTLAQTQAAVDDPSNAFVIVKATEGMGGKNSLYASQRDAAGRKFLGAYHFAWANQDPLKEAANFLTYAALKPGEMAFLDVENWGTGSHPTPEMLATSWATRVGFALAWLDEVRAKSGAVPVVYANWDWIKNLRLAATSAQWARLTAYPLWLADYSGTGGKHSTVTSKDGTSPDSWPIVLHQYLVDTLDRNYTPDLAALRALAVK